MRTDDGRWVYLKCDKCSNHPGQLVEYETGKQQALCFTHWRDVASSVKVVDWINKYGKLQYGNA
jgi:hypothetical protein